MASNSSPSHKPRPRQSSARASAVKIKCSFCGNTFMAPPADAVCQKCGRPANKPLESKWQAISLLVPPAGIVNALLIRPHSPVASKQGLVASIIGSVVYAALYAFLHSVLHLF